jgi:hypothetical protein
MFYRLRVYARYWRRAVYNFNTDVLDVPWSGTLERCLILGGVALVVLHIPFALAARIFERVIWVALHYAMIGWLIVIPLCLGYAVVVKYCIGRRYVHDS